MAKQKAAAKKDAPKGKGTKVETTKAPKVMTPAQMAESLVGKKIKSVVDLGNGFYRITFDDGTAIVMQLVPIDRKSVV